MERVRLFGIIPCFSLLYSVSSVVNKRFFFASMIGDDFAQEGGFPHSLPPLALEGARS